VKLIRKFVILINSCTSWELGSLMAELRGKARKITSPSVEGNGEEYLCSQVISEREDETLL